MEHIELTPELWGLVQEALPELHKLARALARRCNNHTADELVTLAEDSLMRRAPHFIPTKGTRLIDFARRHIRLDLLRAAYTRAHDPCVAAGLRGFDRHEEGLEAPDLTTRFAETLDDKDARARAMGSQLMGAAHYSYAAARAARTPEDELASHEEWRELKRIAAGSAEVAGELLDLLYVRDMTWDEAAALLGMDVRQAQRIEQRAIARLRALIPPAPSRNSP